MNQEHQQILILIGKFQELESLLKIYIGGSYALIQEKIGQTITFNYSYVDVENFPLERLIKTFAKLNKNAGLPSRLRVLKDYRNHIAHKSILIASSSIPSDVKAYFLGFSENPIDFGIVGNELDECIKILIQEIQQLRQLRAQ